MDIFVTLLLAFIVFDLILVGYVVWKRSKKAMSQKDKQTYLEMWSRIQRDSDLRHAVMDADKLLDKLLTYKGYSGSLGEKLKRSGKLFSDLNGVWAAHKLRNRLAHELDARLSDSEGRRALQQFERAYRDLGLL